MFMYNEYMNKRIYSKSLQVLITPNQHKVLMKEAKRLHVSAGSIIRTWIESLEVLYAKGGEQ